MESNFNTRKQHFNLVERERGPHSRNRGVMLPVHASAFDQDTPINARNHNTGPGWYYWRPRAHRNRCRHVCGTAGNRPTYPFNDDDIPQLKDLYI